MNYHSPAKLVEETKNMIRIGKLEIRVSIFQFFNGCFWHIYTFHRRERHPPTSTMTNPNPITFWTSGLKKTSRKRWLSNLERSHGQREAQGLKFLSNSRVSNDLFELGGGFEEEAALCYKVCAFSFLLLFINFPIQLFRLL